MHNDDSYAKITRDTPRWLGIYTAIWCIFSDAPRLRAAAALAGRRHRNRPGNRLGKARGHTIRTRLINVAARVTRHARTITLRLPQHWPWQAAWHTLHTNMHPAPG